MQTRTINTPATAIVHDSIAGPPVEDDNYNMVKSINEKGPGNEVLYESSVLETRLQNVYSNIEPQKQSIQIMNGSTCKHETTSSMESLAQEEPLSSHLTTQNEDKTTSRHGLGSGQSKRGSRLDSNHFQSSDRSIKNRVKP